MEVVKRDSSVEDFESGKIKSAVLRCLVNDNHLPQVIAESVSDDISNRVVNILVRSNGQPVTVERIQDVVEEQLMAAGHFAAAKSYILFRDRRRQQREESYVSPEDYAIISKNKEYFQSPLQEFQYYDKYSRYDEEKGRREAWIETVDRSINFMRSEVERRVGKVITDEEWAWAHEGILTLKALPSMRLIQMAGAPAEYCNVGVYNCAYVAIDSTEVFSEILYILMQGTGVGFSVEAQYVDRLPRIKPQPAYRKTAVVTYLVPDSTEGWCEAVREGIQRWYAGDDIKFDYSLIRPQGAKLTRKGGRASGPEPLRNLLDFIRNKIVNCPGKKLSTLDCHDIVCMIGEIVQVGGVRRAALISLSDLDDLDMREAKFGAYFSQHMYRRSSNNSAVYEEKPGSIEFLKEWTSLASSGSGERGIFNRADANRNLPKRRKKAPFGLNPCGEILLRNRQFCNLTMIVARYEDTWETLTEKGRLATFYGTIQSMMTDFRFIPSTWAENCNEERLLGVDINGQMDCPILRPDEEGDLGRNRDLHLSLLRNVMIDYNKQLAQRLGINQSAAITCVKPDGNSSVFLNCSSGLHPRYAKYYIRRVEVGSYTPMASFLVDAGVPWHPKPSQDSAQSQTYLFEFPVKSPDGALTRDSLSALDQLENWLVLKKAYCEHNASQTIYVRPDEWLEVGAWVYSNWSQVAGISFMPYDAGVYSLTPYEEIDEVTYEKLAAEFPVIDFSKLPRYEKEDTTTISKEYACTSGACEI